MGIIRKKLLLCSLASLVSYSPALALPPPEDTPEEVLRTEIITQARSPVDGKPLSASEYAELKAVLQPYPLILPVNRQLRHLIFQLRLRRQIRLILPFL